MQPKFKPTTIVATATTTSSSLSSSSSSSSTVTSDSTVKLDKHVHIPIPTISSVTATTAPSPPSNDIMHQLGQRSRNFSVLMNRYTNRHRDLIYLGLFALVLTLVSILVSILTVLSVNNNREAAAARRSIVPPASLVSTPQRPAIDTMLVRHDDDDDDDNNDDNDDENLDSDDEDIFIARHPDPDYPGNNNNNSLKAEKFVRVSLDMLQRILNDDKLRTVRTRGLLSWETSGNRRRQRSRRDLEIDQTTDQLLIINHTNVFEIMHRVWANEDYNAFYRNTTSNDYLPTLNIFWAFDASSVPLSRHITYYAVKEYLEGDRVGLKFVEITNKISRYQRTLLIRRAIRDAMNEWSNALDHQVMFHEIPFSRKTLHQRVVLIAFRPPLHQDERSHQFERFDSGVTKTIAHAAFNLLHLNNAFQYQLMPRPITVSIPFVLSYPPDHITATNRSHEQQQQQHLYVANHHDFELIYNRTFVDLYPHILKPRKLSTRTNLAAVLIHEIGHVLGLGHYFYETEKEEKEEEKHDRSIMMPVYTELLSSLSPLDRLAVRTLFEHMRGRTRKSEDSSYIFPSIRNNR